MENKIVKETIELYRKLSPTNQKYILSIVQVASMAEDSAKRELVKNLLSAADITTFSNDE